MQRSTRPGVAAPPATAEPSTGAPASEASAEREDAPRTPGPRLGIRARILVLSIGTLVLAVSAAVVAVRVVMFAQVDGRIEAALEQESDELRRLAGGRDPSTGEPFGDDVERIFDVFLARNVPNRNETYLSFVDGELHEQTFRAPPYDLSDDASLVASWTSSTEAVRGSAETPAGSVEYLAVPILSGGEQRGVFVVAYFRDLEAAEVGPATAAAAGVGFLTILIGSLVAWRVAEGVLAPVRRTTEAARQFSTSDLTRRVPVSGSDEIAQLGSTFNDLLSRLEVAFATQQRFVDDAGHELRTPITIIRGHLELLDDEPEDRERTLALVQDELERMRRIVADLLTLAKAGGPGFLSLEPVDLASMIPEIVSKAEVLGPRSWAIDGTPRGVIVADRQRLTQAVMQLVHNAVEHTPPGAAIAIGGGLRGDEAALWVRDGGPGISAEDRARIFERFARGRGRRASDGAGLGLSIVSAIAEAHGGRVTLRSSPREGSTFTIVVPVDQPHPDAGEHR